MAASRHRIVRARRPRARGVVALAATLGTLAVAVPAASSPGADGAPTVLERDLLLTAAAWVPGSAAAHVRLGPVARSAPTGLQVTGRSAAVERTYDVGGATGVAAPLDVRWSARTLRGTGPLAWSATFVAPDGSRATVDGPTTPLDAGWADATSSLELPAGTSHLVLRLEGPAAGWALDDYELACPHTTACQRAGVLVDPTGEVVPVTTTSSSTTSSSTTTTVRPTTTTRASTTTTTKATTTTTAAAKATTTTSTAKATTTTKGHATTTRAPAQVRTEATAAAPQRPFAASSPWNAPLSNPTWGDLPPTLADDPGWINRATYSFPSYVGTASDPVRSLCHPEGWGWPAGCEQVHVPDSAMPAAGDDANFTVVDTTTGLSHDVWNVTAEGRGWRAEAYARTPVAGSGFTAEGAPAAAGTRASGANGLGGVLTAEDLDGSTIDHALAISLGNHQLAPWFVRPAVAVDGDAWWAYTGDIPMGSRLAIGPWTPKPTDLTPVGSRLWDAFVTYGGLVVDRAGGFTLYANPRTTTEAQVDPLRTHWAPSGGDLARIIPVLRLVS